VEAGRGTARTIAFVLDLQRATCRGAARSAASAEVAIHLRAAIKTGATGVSPSGTGSAHEPWVAGPPSNGLTVPFAGSRASTTALSRIRLRDGAQRAVADDRLGW
jgi:hypothetical protein